MTDSIQELERGLYSRDTGVRLNSLRALAKLAADGALPLAAPSGHVNNHIHTTYSFSPYTPSAAVYTARLSGLLTAGITDHDSLRGAAEFREAGRVFGVLTTSAVELRVSAANTPLESLRINNPDQTGCAYVAIHGVPPRSWDALDAALAPCRAKRCLRNRAMLDRINAISSSAGIVLDYDRDVLPLSYDFDGGSVTERHLLYALAMKLAEKYGRGAGCAAALTERLGLELSGKVRERLCDAQNPYYDYDLLGLLKSSLVSRFYIDATDECLHISDIPRLAAEYGAVSAYAYLGDVGDSVTGDKKAQTFEDSYLDELIVLLRTLGFNAVAYMPSRNTDAQLSRLMRLCRENNLLQISGEDINSPRQSFCCDALLRPQYAHLVRATYALIGQENASERDPREAMFSPQAQKACPDVAQRAALYADIAKKMKGGAGD